MVRFMRAFLQLNGVSFLPVDEHTERGHDRRHEQAPRSEAPKVYTRLEDMPTDDTIVTYFMPLDYVSPQEASGIFQLTAPPHTYGQYVPAPSAQGIILTEEASVVRELVSLKILVDVLAGQGLDRSSSRSNSRRPGRPSCGRVLDGKMLNIGPNGQPVAAAGPNGTVLVRPDVGSTRLAQLSRWREEPALSGPGAGRLVSDPRAPTATRLIITVHGEYR